MEAYKELLAQFHSQQAATIQQQSHLQYIQLLNQLKSSKQKKLQQRNKFMFQSSRLKSYNDNFIKNSTVQKNLQASRIDNFNDTYKEKRSLIELQRQSLLQEIDDLNEGFRKLRGEKQLVESEIRLIDKKEIQISSALGQSVNSLQEVRSLIKEQRIVNDRQFNFYDKKVKQLTLKLQSVNQQNMFNSRFYKEVSTKKTQNQNKNILGTILMWQSQQNKIKKIPKKIYTKNQIQSMLRALFLLVQFSGLNYGNIIEHLIKIAASYSDEGIQSLKTLKQLKPDNKIYLDDKGKQIQIKDLIKLLEAQLLTTNECKFLSKAKLIEFYEKKGIIIESNWQGNQLSQQTIKLTDKVIQHYQKLTSWFSRIQKRNIQLTQSFRSLQKIQQQLDNQIKSIQNSAVQKSINYLQSRQQQIQNLHEKLNSACKVIFQFNINVYDLIRRFQNLNKFFDKIVKSTNRKTYRKTFIEVEEVTSFLKKITKVLFKSPQCIILDWQNVIKSQKTNSQMISTSESFRKMPDNHIYLQKIMKNDLLRIYAEPSMFDAHKSYIDNFQATFDSVINQESESIQKLCKILEDLLLFSRDGMKEFQGYKIELKQQRRRQSILRSQKTKNSLNPLLKILQQSDSKPNKFFKKDQIKQEDHPNFQQQGFCVQSDNYYRRDNFKLIQKLQKLNLKKKGLLASVPFSVNTSLELQPHMKTSDNILVERQTSRLGSTRNSYRKLQPRLSHQLMTSRHNMLSQRRQKENSRKKDLKMLLNNISNIATQNQKYRIRKKLITNDISFNMSTSRLHMSASRLHTTSVGRLG